MLYSSKMGHAFHRSFRDQPHSCWCPSRWSTHFYSLGTVILAGVLVQAHAGQERPCTNRREDWNTCHAKTRLSFVQEGGMPQIIARKDHDYDDDCGYNFLTNLVGKRMNSLRPIWNTFPPSAGQKFPNHSHSKYETTEARSCSMKSQSGMSQDFLTPNSPKCSEVLVSTFEPFNKHWKSARW